MEQETPHEALQHSIQLAKTVEVVKEQLDTLHVQYNIDEFIFHTPLLNRQARTESFQLLGKVYEHEHKLKQVT